MPTYVFYQIKNIKIFNNKNKYIEIGKYTSPLKLFEYMSQGKTIIVRLAKY